MILKILSCIIRVYFTIFKVSCSCCYPVAQSCLTLCDSMDCSTQGFPVLHYLLEFAYINAHWVSDAIQPSHPLPPTLVPALNLSQHQGVLKWIGSSHQLVKVLELQLQHQSFQWIFRVDFFKIDWFDLLVLQGTLKSLLQHCSSKASILRHSTFFMVQLSHPYMTAKKSIWYGYPYHSPYSYGS